MRSLPKSDTRATCPGPVPSHAGGTSPATGPTGRRAERGKKVSRPLSTAILFVGFSDDCGLIFFRFGVVLLLIVVIVIWVSWRHDEHAEVDQIGGDALGGACGHVRAPVNVATFTLQLNAVGAA